MPKGARSQIIFDVRDNATKKVEKIRGSLDNLDNTLGGVTGGFGRASGALGRMTAATAAATGPVGIVVAAIAAATGGAFMLAKSTADLAKEQQNLALQAGQTYELFNATAYAFSKVGLSADNTSDIILSMNERIGELNSEGAGPLAEFLKKLGKGSDELRQKLKTLSGIDALIAVRDAMTAAGMSAQEITFYLEDFASGSARLTDLLYNNGEQLKKTQKEYDSFFGGLDDAERNELKEFSNRVTKLTTQASLLAGELGAAAAEEFNDFAESISKIKTLTVKATQSLAEMLGLVNKPFTLQMHMPEGIDQDATGTRKENEAKARAERVAKAELAAFGESVWARHDEGVKAAEAEAEKKKEILDNTLIYMQEETAACNDNILTDSEKFLERLAENQETWDELAFNSLDRLSEGFGEVFATAIMDSENLGEATKQMFAGMVQNLLAFVGEWIAQKLIMWALEKMIGTTSAGTMANSKALQGAAQVQEAGLAAFSSTAAIPIVGPFLAPAAAALAMTQAGIMAGAMSTLYAASAGAQAAHGGLSYVPNEQTYLLQRGERVLSPRQNTDLTEFIGGGGTSAGNTTVNINGGNGSPDQIARAVGRVLSKRNKRIDTAVSNANRRGNRNRGVFNA